jgi:hypothetical protein
MFNKVIFTKIAFFANDEQRSTKYMGYGYTNSVKG